MYDSAHPSKKSVCFQEVPEQEYETDRTPTSPSETSSVGLNSKLILPLKTETQTTTTIISSPAENKPFLLEKPSCSYAATGVNIKPFAQLRCMNVC